MKIKITFFLLVFCVATTMAQSEFPVYFDSNKSEVKKSELPKLESWIASHGTVKIVAINGFCDEDGTVGFNDTLARKRVNAVLALIKDKVKIRSDFKTRSYGERHKHSAIKSENRKVVIYYIEAKDLSRENEILGIQEEKPVAKVKKAPVYSDKVTVRNPNGSETVIPLDVAFMKKISDAETGTKIALQDLNFQINTFAIVQESRPKLYELLMVMQQNPDLRIDIQGHLCCMPNDRIDLSTKRAKAISGFLQANGIDKSRITYQGFGSTKAIYPLPEKNEEERAANRRVEIEILSK
ncbi:OmpA family protein [Flavobacterium kingsejongi]|uniref:Cell envelope biogenesis protein OmpA n=1 Tax=Flavobacterium kingsejongi TaxID=1678728 RepID=A0A2S1LPE3_9FLAO|nr:OmpA family protein [Flavobacterium kingsejongi]AWG25623.1 cell envelope biogenesis protein OmpA [Flavobacterium kingsejongi]